MRRSRFTRESEQRLTDGRFESRAFKRADGRFSYSLPD